MNYDGIFPVEQKNTVFEKEKRKLKFFRRNKERFKVGTRRQK